MFGKDTPEGANFVQAGKGLTNEQITEKFGPPPTDALQLKAWSEKVKQALGAAGGEKGPYQQAAEAQAAQSHVGLNGAFGSSNWTQDPKTGQWTQSQSFAPGLQGTVDGLEQQIGSQGPIGSGQDAADAAYKQSASRLDPQFAQGQEALSAQLAAQGLDPGTQAGQTAQGNFDRSKNDAYSSAQNNAWSQGLALRGQNMQAQMLPYQQLQGLNSLLGNAQNPGQAMAPQDLQAMQAQFAQNQGITAASNQNSADIFTGATQVAKGAAAVASDSRIKTDIRRLEVDGVPGVPLATFKYKNDPAEQDHIGMIAQDLEKVLPQAVVTGKDGIKRIDYSKIPKHLMPELEHFFS